MLRQTENAFRFFVMWTACAAKTAGVGRTPPQPGEHSFTVASPMEYAEKYSKIKKRPLSRCVESENLTDNKTLHAAKFSRFSVYGRRVC